MEKSAGKKRRLRIGLLIFAFMLYHFFASNAYTISWEAVQNLQFRKTEKYFFTATECPLIVTIENVLPEKVSVFVNDVPNNVSFISAKKETFIPTVTSKSVQQGTRLILYFTFERPGEYHIQPVDVRIDGLYCRVPIEPVSVYENPNFMKPELSVQFTSPTLHNGTEKNIRLSLREHVHFTLYIKYAVQVVHFSWDIPENSLFIEQNRYEITKRNIRGTDFSPESVPIASFDWEPLKAGTYKMPSFYITATSYSGIKYDVTLPDFLITVDEKTSLSYSQNTVTEETILKTAFLENDSASKQESYPSPSQKDIETLLQLHQKERHSIPFINKKILQERKTAEESFGISFYKKEPNIPLFIFLGALSLILFLLSFLLFLFKKKALAVVMVPCGFLAALCFIFLAADLSKKSALFTGIGFRPIPEYSIEISEDIPAGNTIFLEKKGGSWYFAHFGEKSGWVPQEDVLLIK